MERCLRREAKLSGKPNGYREFAEVRELVDAPHPRRPGIFSSELKEFSYENFLTPPIRFNREFLPPARH